MPYIIAGLRELIDEDMANLDTPAELNYKITKLFDNYIQRNGLKYNTINDLVGVLGCVQMELYRRIAAPYEDKKIKENGDVYTINV